MGSAFPELGRRQSFRRCEPPARGTVPSPIREHISSAALAPAG
jgi:hypothetical protein